MGMPPVPRAELQRCVNAVAETGSQTKAAEALHLTRSTLRDRLRIAARDGLAPTAKNTASACLDQKVKESGSRIRTLERQIDGLNAQIDAMRRARPLVLPKAGRGNRLAGATKIRVILSDTHGHHVDRQALAAVMSDLEKFRVDEVVLLGDHLDCGGWLAQHHTLGFVAETQTTFEDDVEATNSFLDELQKRTGRVDTYYIVGNHEARIEKFCVTAALRNSTDAKFLLDRIGPQHVLQLEKRGIQFIHHGTRYHNLPIPGSIQLGKCVFTHPSEAPKYASAALLKKYGGNLVFGHTHRVDATIGFSVLAGTIGAWGVGCLCQRQPLWMHTNPTDWSHAYGLQLVGANGDFLHITVPVIDGVSYLQPLVSQLGA